MVTGILDRLFQHRSIEDPTDMLRDPEAWLEATGGGVQTLSGIRVTADAALSHHAVWRAVNMICQDVGKIPLHLYRREGGGKVRATNHPVYQMLRRKPCPEVTILRFLMTLTAHKLLHGNGYAWIRRHGDGSLSEMLPLSPLLTRPVRDTKEGKLWYMSRIGKQEVPFRPEEILHIRGLGETADAGYSVIEHARQSIGTTMAAEQHAGAFFGNSAMPGVILEHPGNLDPETIDRLRKSWDGQHRGVGRAFRPAVLEEGMKATTLSFSAKDAQLIESQKFGIVVVAGWFGVPPHKLGDDTRTSHASLADETQSYIDGALDGHLSGWEDEFYDKLLTPKERASDEYVVEFLRASLVRNDLESRAKAHQISLAGVPYRTVDEVRADENMAPLPNGAGAELIVPINVQEPDDGAEDEGAGDTPPIDTERSAAQSIAEQRNVALSLAVRDALLDRARQMVRRIAKDAIAQARTPGTFTAWVDKGMERRHGAVVYRDFLPAARACAVDPCGAVGVSCEVGMEAKRALFRVIGDSLNAVAESATAETLLAETQVAAGEWPTTVLDRIRSVLWSNCDGHPD